LPSRKAAVLGIIAVCLRPTCLRCSDSDNDQVMRFICEKFFAEVVLAALTH